MVSSANLADVDCLTASDWTHPPC